MTAIDAIMEGIRDTLRTNPENRLAWLAYADALQDAGDPRGELYAMMLLPRERRSDDERYWRLRGTVPLLGDADLRTAAVLLGAVSATRAWDSHGEMVRRLGRLAAHLRECCHPLADAVARCGPCGGDTVVILNERRFVVGRGRTTDPGAYPDPVEAAIAGIATAFEGHRPLRLMFQGAGGPHGPWPVWWGSLIV